MPSSSRRPRYKVWEIPVRKHFKRMKYKVLLCEDNPADRDLMEAALRASGLTYKLEIAHNGEEARALIQSLGDGNFLS
jgi:hypothetical protein